MRHRQIATSKWRRAASLPRTTPYNKDTGNQFTGSCAASAAIFCLLAAAPAFAQLDKAIELQRQGHAQEASAIFEKEIPALRAAGDQTQLARALSLAGEAFLSTGKYQLARQRSQDALDLHTRLKDSVAQARDWNALALSDMYLGNYDASLNEYQAALKLDRANGDREGEIARLDNMGNVYYYQGRYLDALHSYSTALERVNAAPNERWSARRHQITIVNLATLFQRLGDEQRALAMYSESAGRIAALRPSEAAQMLLNQGVLYRRLGDPLKALEMYRSAQGLFAKDQHRDGEIGALRNIGIARGLDLQDLPGALEAFTAALKLARESGNGRLEVQAELYSGDILRRMQRADEAEAALDRAATGARHVGLVEEQWKALYAAGLLARSRGDASRAARCFEDAIRLIESVRAGLQLASLKTDFLADKRDVYDALIELRLDSGQPNVAEIWQLVEQGRARTLQDQLAFGKNSRVSLGGIQAQLGPQTMLVEYWIGENAAAALWIRNNTAGLVRKQFTAEQLADVSALTDAMAQGSPQWRSLAAHAGHQLLDGLPLDGVRHLVFTADGVLQTLPFAALELPSAGALVVEKFDVSYLPSTTLVLKWQPPRRDWRFPWQRELVAIGDPVTGSETVGSDGITAERWQPLPRAASEIRAIAQILNGRAERHLGSDARKTYLIASRIAAVPLLHFSTHAAADMRDPERSRILLAPADQNAGFDYLFLREIYGLDLKGVQLVTVSACDTERGKLVRGEGAQGFSRAFLAAGAAASVTSLWRLVDESAAEFMKQFYFGLSRGQSKAEALRAAQLAFLHSGSALAHPRYWAAFVLSGDGQSPIVQVIPWTVLAGLCGTGILACVGLWWLITRRRSGSG